VRRLQVRADQGHLSQDERGATTPRSAAAGDEPQVPDSMSKILELNGKY
jgi:hypothetical protein